MQPTKNTSETKSSRDQRRARNYLLDPRFQLKYTGMLVVVALLVSAVLGVEIWFTSNEVVTQSQQAVEQGRETVRRGQAAVVESKNVSEVVRMNIAREYADAPDLASQFNADADKREKALEEEQKRLESDANALEMQAERLAAHQLRTLFILVGCLAVLVVAIAMSGIVFTHKIAGPVYKMTGLLNKVAKGQLSVNTGLRKGDELVQFFETFRAMVDRLRERHEDTVKRLEQSIQELKGEVSEQKLASLKKLHEEMAARLQE